MITDHFINAFKTALACLLGFIVIRFLPTASSQWVIITIIVVMSAQIHFGSALQKAYLRLLGTVAGALIAGATLYFFKTDNFMIISAVIILSAFLFSLLGGISVAMGQSMTLGSVTVPIILLTPHVTLWAAYFRMSEILLGIVIAILVNLFVFPLHAKHKLDKLLIKNMGILKNYHLNHTKSEKIMMENFTEAELLLADAKREFGVNEQHYHDIILHQKRLFRAISLSEYFPSPNIQRFISQELETLIKLCS
ncbi:MAG TPA: FUSC family protein [Gammaproteobacteria bacterium]|nr:FUSC family protein [Gammaproteobacteria bacterium]